jgi:hypothetical protein
MEEIDFKKYPIKLEVDGATVEISEDGKVTIDGVLDTNRKVVTDHCLSPFMGMPHKIKENT